ncbi:MAG: protein kinase [Vicinamibacterales bacterium]
MPPPTTIGKYEVRHEIGRGGVGIVYLAFDAELRREVAIKLLRGDFDDDSRDRFLRGAQVLSRLRHPNIVTVFEYGHLAGQPYIVMEYVVGTSLRTLIQQRSPVTLARKLQIIDDICCGMAYAHTHQIIHRDLKPENVVIDGETGSARIVDFDLSRSVRTNASHFTQGVGTIHYMPPEQFFGQSDSRSDIFSIAAIAYELIAFTQAFDGDSPEAMHKIFAEKAVSLAKRCPGLDRRLVKTVHRALAKNPIKRHQTLEQVRDEIAAVSSSIPPELIVHPAQLTPLRRDFSRKVAGALIGVSLFTLVAAWLLVRTFGASPASTSSQGGSPSATSSPVVQPSKSDPNQIAPANGGTLTSDRATASTPAVPSTELPRTRVPQLPSAASPPFNVFSTAPGGIATAPQLTLRQYLPLESQLYSFALSAVPRLMVRVADFSTKIRVSELTTGREVRTFEGGASRLCLSDDGRRLAAVQKDASSRGSTLTVWDVSTGADIQKIKLQEPIRAMVFDSRGEALALASEGGHVRVIDTMKGLQTQQFDALRSAEADSLAFSPDDRLLAVGTPAGLIQVWNVPSGQIARTFNVPRSLEGQSAESHVEFTRDGARIAGATDKAGWTIWELSTGRKMSSFGPDDPAVPSALAFSPDGSWLAVGGQNASVTVWNVATNRVVLRLTPAVLFSDSRLTLPVTSLEFSPDATLLIAGTAAGVQLWQRIP